MDFNVVNTIFGYKCITYSMSTKNTYMPLQGHHIGVYTDLLFIFQVIIYANVDLSQN